MGAKKIERPTIWRSNRIDSIELLCSKIEKVSHLTSANHNVQSQQSNKYVMKKHKKQIRTNRVKAEKIIKKNCPNTDIFLQELWNRARNEGIKTTLLTALPRRITMVILINLLLRFII